MAMKLWRAFEFFTEQLFRRSLESKAANLETHIMSSGSQGGRDVVVSFLAPNARKVTIYIECKYYRKQPVDSSEIRRKVDQALNCSFRPDHWILLAPEKGLDKEADDTIGRLQEHEKLPFDIHRWDSGSAVETIGILFNEIADKDDVDETAFHKTLRDDAWWSAFKDELDEIGQAVLSLRPYRTLKSGPLACLTLGLFSEGDEDPGKFLNGHPVSWRLLTNPESERYDIPRTVAPALMEQVINYRPKSSAPRIKVYVLSGISGNGKSVLLRRLAADIFFIQRAVWYLERAHALFTDTDVADFVEETLYMAGVQPPVFIVDSFQDAKEWLPQVARALESKGIQGVALCADTDVRLERLEKETADIPRDLLQFEHSTITLDEFADRRERRHLSELAKRLSAISDKGRKAILEHSRGMPLIKVIVILGDAAYQGDTDIDKWFREKTERDYLQLSERNQIAYAWVTLSAYAEVSVSPELLDALLEATPGVQPGDEVDFKIHVEKWSIGKSSRSEPITMSLVHRDYQGNFGTHRVIARDLWDEERLARTGLVKDFLVAARDMSMRTDAGFTKSLFFLGRALTRLKDEEIRDIGIILLSRNLELSNEDMGLRVSTRNSCLELGRLCMKRNRDDEAEKLFRESLDIDPKGVHARLELGRLCMKRNRDDEAEELFRESLDIDPKGVYSRHGMISLLIKRKRVRAAYEVMMEGLNYSQPNAYIAQSVGLAVYSAGNRPLGLQLLTYAHRRQPRNLKGYSIFASRVLESGGALLRLYEKPLMEGPTDRIRGYERAEIEDIRDKTLNAVKDMSTGRFQGEIVKFGFNLDKHLFFIHADESEEISDESRELCCFLNEWLGPEMPEPGMKATFNIAPPMSKNPNAKKRAVNVRPAWRKEFDLSKPLELPSDPGFADKNCR